mmetsp:Transcript_12957/g.29378  ORF Transcript_12957/g.29378 Transcript_12957/m.29378 type:complete len:267 (+) Transcript_12957:1068-1868(+)
MAASLKALEGAALLRVELLGRQRGRQHADVDDTSEAITLANGRSALVREIASEEDNVALPHWHSQGCDTLLLKELFVTLVQHDPILAAALAAPPAGDLVVEVVASRPTEEATILELLVRECNAALDALEAAVRRALVEVVVRRQPELSVSGPLKREAILGAVQLLRSIERLEDALGHAFAGLREDPTSLVHLHHVALVARPGVGPSVPPPSAWVVPADALRDTLDPAPHAVVLGGNLLGSENAGEHRKALLVKVLEDPLSKVGVRQ